MDVLAAAEGRASEDDRDATPTYANGDLGELGSQSTIQQEGEENKFQRAIAVWRGKNLSVRAIVTSVDWQSS